MTFTSAHPAEDHEQNAEHQTPFWPGPGYLKTKYIEYRSCMAWHRHLQPTCCMIFSVHACQGLCVSLYDPGADNFQCRRDTAPASLNGEASRSPLGLCSHGMRERVHGWACTATTHPGREPSAVPRRSFPPRGTWASTQSTRGQELVTSRVVNIHVDQAGHLGLPARIEETHGIVCFVSSG